MDFYKIIADNFQDTIETIAMSVDQLAQPIERSSELVTAALLADRKIIACGLGADAALAQLFVSYFQSHFEHERPALPALALGCDSTTLTSIAHGSGINDIYSRQLRALGEAGDVLLCINSSASTTGLLRAVQAAHDRDMGVILLSHSQDRELGALLRSNDVALCIETPRQARIVEIHTMVIHCLCALIEQSLFGAYAPE